MEKLGSIREQYHIAIRRNKRQRVLQTLRNQMVYDFIPNPKVQHIVERIKLLDIACQKDQVAGILRDLQSVDSLNLNNKAILWFLCKVAGELCTTRENFKMLKSTLQLLNNFTSCADQIVLLRLDLLCSILWRPEMLPLFQNLICLSEWNPAQKSKVLFALCTCLKNQTTPDISQIRYLYWMILNNLEVEEGVLRQVLNVLYAYHQMQVKDKEDQEVRDEQIYCCVKNLLAGYKGSAGIFVKHGLYTKMMDLLQEMPPTQDDFSNRTQQCVLEIISVLTEESTFEIDSRVYMAIIRASRSKREELILTFVETVRRLFKRGMVSQITGSGLLGRIVSIVLASDGRGNVKIESTEVVMEMLLNLESEEMLAKMQEERCLQVLMDGLRKGESEIVSKGVDCLYALMKGWPDVIDTLVKESELLQVLWRLSINHRDIGISKRIEGVMKLIEEKITACQ